MLGGNPNTQVRLLVTKRDGRTVKLETRHTLSADQISWIRAGSALNYIREQKARV